MFQTKLCFLLCMFFVNTHADNLTMIYNVIAVKEFTFLPDWSKMIFNLSGSLAVKLNGNTRNSYIIEALNANAKIFIKVGEKTEEIKFCEFAAIAFKTPFIIFNDDNGLIQKIKVTKNDLDLLVNLKFLLATLLQVNVKKVFEQEKPQFVTNTNELTIYGRCDVDYLIEQIIPNTENKYTVLKTYDVESCVTDFPVYFEEEYLNKTCSSKLHKQSMSNRKIDLIMQAIPAIRTFNINGLSKSEIVNYRPFSDTDDRIIGIMTGYSELVSITESELTNGLEAVDVDVDAFKYVKPNETLFTAKDSPVDDLFIKFYRALACDSKMNIYSQIIEAALLCSA